MNLEIELLKKALVEIQQLRRRNSLMNARLTMFDNIMVLLNTQPISNTQRVMHPDLVHEIDKFVHSQTEVK